MMDCAMLLRRVRNDGDFTVPGGIEPGESPADACIRTLPEEIGLAALELRVDKSKTHASLERTLRTNTVRVAALGEPERVRNSAENVYRFVWVRLNKLPDPDLTPRETKEILMRNVS
jgi:8-oxo-dGTP pyrophosphatase MutT (NUDIX family)